MVYHRVYLKIRIFPYRPYLYDQIYIAALQRRQSIRERLFQIHSIWILRRRQILPHKFEGRFECYPKILDDVDLYGYGDGLPIQMPKFLR